MTSYDQLAEVYDWLVPDALLQPEGSAAAFGPVLERLEPGACVLDCAAGTGTLAVGLALRGFAVTATDASAAMVERTRALASTRNVAIDTGVARWEDLPPDAFDAVFCVGNSLTHARDRRAALRAMAGALRSGGLFAATSRDWEQVRAAGSRSENQVVERDGQRAHVHYEWTIPDRWDEPHGLDVRVDGVGERLTFWPFRHDELLDDLRAAGFSAATSTYGDGADRYLVTAVRGLR